MMGRGLLHGAAPAVALLALTACAFPGRCDLAGAVGEGEDLAEHDLPQAALFGRTLARGELPLWNPHKGLGVPATEAPFMGPYYPGFLLHLLLPPGAALNLGFLGHIFLSGLFMFWLCRGLGAGALAAGVGAASWILSSVFRLYAHEGWLPETVAACYLPAACHLLLGLGRVRGAALLARRLAGAGAVLALMILGGHPAYALVAALLALLFGLTSVETRGRVLLVLASFVLAAALSSPAWGPMLYEGTLAPRGGLEELGKTPSAPFSPGDLLNYLSYDTGEGRLHFVGRPLLLLGLVGAALCLRRRCRGVPVTLVAAGLLAVNAGGAATGIPLLNLVSAPGTWHMGVVLALCVGGTLALHWLGQALSSWRRRAPLALVLAVGLLQLADLVVYRAQMPVRLRQPLDAFYRTEPFQSFLAKDRSLYRVVTSPEDGPLWRVNQGTLAGVDCYNSRVKGVSTHRLNGMVSLSSEVEHRLDPRLLRLINVKYWLITRDDLTWDEARHPEGFELAAKQVVTLGQRKYLAVVLRHRDPFARAFLVGGPGQEDPHPVLMGITPDPLQRLQIPARAWKLLEARRPVKVQRQGNSYRVRYKTSEQRILILSEMFHPAWSATLDGEPLALAPMMGVFMGATAPWGEHEIIFEYRPVHLYWCWGASLVGLLMVVGVMALSRRRLNREPATGTGEQGTGSGERGTE